MTLFPIISSFCSLVVYAVSLLVCLKFPETEYPCNSCMIFLDLKKWLFITSIIGCITSLIAFLVSVGDCVLRSISPVEVKTLSSIVCLPCIYVVGVILHFVWFVIGICVLASLCTYSACAKNNPTVYIMSVFVLVWFLMSIAINLIFCKK